MSRMRRSTSGLDTPRGDDWRQRALCRGRSNLFESSAYRSFAAHICRKHCPVLDECKAWAAGTSLREITAAGEYWTSFGRPSLHLQQDLVGQHNAYCRALAAAVEEEE